MSNKSKDFKQIGKDIARKTMGRPLKGAEPLDVSITIRLTEREAANLAFYCLRHDTTVSAVVRDSLDLLSITGL